jgi:hypothetical protein
MDGAKASLFLRLVDSEGGPLNQRIEVDLKPVSGGDHMVAVLDPGKATEVTIAGLRPGVYRMAIRSVSLSPLTRFITVEPGAREAQEIVFYPRSNRRASMPLVSRRDLGESTSPTTIEIFISYAHEDEALLQTLDQHLAPLKRAMGTTVWHDRLIQPGADFEKEIKAVLERSKIILLLVSPAFVNSDYCYETEMKLALSRHESGSARAIPIILRPVDWQITPLRQLNALPKDGRPITSWHPRDNGFLNVVHAVRDAVVAMRNERD